MKCCPAVCALLCSAALLPSRPAAADAQVRGAATGRLAATAQVDFKIVIPAALSLAMLDGLQSGGVRTVAVGSNGRLVALAATLQGSEWPRRDLLVRAAPRRNIAQQAPCELGAAHAGQRLVCTVSMP